MPQRNFSWRVSGSKFETLKYFCRPLKYSVYASSMSQPGLSTWTTKQPTIYIFFNFQGNDHAKFVRWHKQLITTRLIITKLKKITIFLESGNSKKSTNLLLKSYSPIQLSNICNYFVRKGRFHEKSCCSYGFCPNYLDPCLLAQIWTKSKRTATFFLRETFPKKTNVTLFHRGILCNFDTPQV